MEETAARSAATSHWFVTGPASNATPAARLAAAADASQGSPGPSLPAGTAVMRQKLGVRLHGRTPFFFGRTRANCDYLQRRSGACAVFPLRLPGSYCGGKPADFASIIPPRLSASKTEHLTPGADARVLEQIAGRDRDRPGDGDRDAPLQPRGAVTAAAALNSRYRRGCSVAPPPAAGRSRRAAGRGSDPAARSARWRASSLQVRACR